MTIFPPIISGWEEDDLEPCEKRPRYLYYVEMPYDLIGSDYVRTLLVLYYNKVSILTEDLGEVSPKYCDGFITRPSPRREYIDLCKLPDETWVSRFVIANVNSIVWTQCNISTHYGDGQMTNSHLDFKYYAKSYRSMQYTAAIWRVPGMKVRRLPVPGESKRLKYFSAEVDKKTRFSTQYTYRISYGKKKSVDLGVKE